MKLTAYIHDSHAVHCSTHFHMIHNNSNNEIIVGSTHTQSHNRRPRSLQRFPLWVNRNKQGGGGVGSKISGLKRLVLRAVLKAEQEQKQSDGLHDVMSSIELDLCKRKNAGTPKKQMRREGQNGRKQMWTELIENGGRRTEYRWRRGWFCSTAPAQRGHPEQGEILSVQLFLADSWMKVHMNAVSSASQAATFFHLFYF